MTEPLNTEATDQEKYPSIATVSAIDVLPPIEQQQVPTSSGNRYDEAGALITGAYTDEEEGKDKTWKQVSSGETEESGDGEGFAKKEPERQVGTTQEQTKALNLDEIKANDNRFLKIAVEFAGRETNSEDIDALIDKLESETGIFDPETGDLGGIDPTVALEAFIEKYPDSKSTQGAEKFKDYLRAKIDRKNSTWHDGSPEALKIAAAILPGLTRFSAMVGRDLDRVAGRVAHDTGQGVLGLAGMLLEDPIESVASMFTSDQEGKDFARSMFTLSTYVDKPKPPTTAIGKFAEPTLEYGMALYTGGKILNSVSKKIGKHNNILKSSIASLTRDMPRTMAAGYLIAKEAVGGPIHISPKNRLANYLKEFFPDNELIKDLVGQPDDNSFMRAFRTAADSTLAGTVLATSLPIIALTARGLYNWNKPIAEEIVRLTETWRSKVRYLRPKDVADRISDGIELPKKTGDLLHEVEAIAKQKDETIVALNQEKAKSPKNSLAIDAALEKRGVKLENNQLVPIVQKTSTITAKDKVSLNAVIEKVLKDPNSLVLDETIQKVLNVKRINSTDERHTYINQLAKIFEDGYFKKGKTNLEITEQGKLIEDELLVLVGEDNLAAYYKNWADSTNQTPAMAAAIRHYLWEEGKLWKESSDRITGLIKAKIDPTPEQLTDFFIDAYRYLGSLETDLKVASNIARTQQYRRYLIGAEEKELKDIIKLAASGELTGTDNLIAMAKNVSEGDDILQLRSQLNNETGFLYKVFHGEKVKSQNGLLSNLTTIAGASLGMGAWMVQTGAETIVQVGLNQVGKRWYEFTGNTWLGKGQGMTWTAAKAEMFGMTQAFGEVFLGKGYIKESPIGQAGDAFRTMETKSVGNIGQKHEIRGTAINTSPIVKQEILGKDYTMAPGYNAEMTKILPEFLGLEHNQIGKILKVLANGYGFIHSAAGRMLIAEDQFFRNIFERREIHKLSVLRAEKLVVNELENAKQIAIDAGEEVPVVSMKEYHRQVDHMYHKVLTNLPPDISDEAARIAQEGLMQEKLPKLLQHVERIRDTTSDLKAGKDWLPLAKNGTIDKTQAALNAGENAIYGAGNIAINVPKNLVASQTNFLRTGVNIVNQQLYERGPGKLIKIFANNRQRTLLFQKNETFKQEVLSKVITGTALLYYGAGLGNNFDSDDYTIYSKGIGSFDPESYYLNKQEGSGGPEIIKRNSDGTETSFSLARIDPLNYSLMLGAIYGSWRQKHLEIMEYRQLQADGTYLNFEQDQIDDIKELDDKLLYALGNWATQLPVLKPIKNTAQAIFPQLSPTGGASSWDRRMAKELANWMVYLNPLENGLSSLRKSLHKTVQPFKTYGPGFEERVEKPFGPNAGMKTEVGVAIPEMREMAIHFKEFSALFLEEYEELIENMRLMDVTNPKYPKVGYDTVGYVDVEGYMIRHIPDSGLNKVILGFKNISLPFYPRIAQRNSTMELIIGLDLKGRRYSQASKDPRKWENQFTKGSVLTLEQRYGWAVYAGQRNRETFNTPEYKRIVQNIKNGHYNSVEKLADKISLQMVVDKLLRANNLQGFLDMAKHENNEGLLKKLLTLEEFNKIALKN